MCVVHRTAHIAARYSALASFRRNVVVRNEDSCQIGQATVYAGSSFP